MSNLNRLFALIGAAVSGYALWKVAAPELLQRRPSPFLNAAPPDATALVTGASSGIGAAFARRLARHGYHLVISGRRQERLDALAEDLRQRCGVRVRTVNADLSQEEGMKRVAAVTEELAEAGMLDLLVNNAGFGTTETFVALPYERHLEMLNVHVTASVRLTRAALPGMLARRRGGVINVASIAGWFPLPGNVTYSATKRYLITFSQALQMELWGSGVFVQALCPGFTFSEFHDAAPYRAIGFRRDALPGVMWQSAEQVVEASLNQLGSEEVVCVPGVHNRVLTLLSSAVPRSAVQIARRLMSGLGA